MNVKFEDKTPLEKTRGRAKRDLMAKGYAIAKELAMTGETVKGRLNQLADHQIDEWTCFEGIHEDLMTLHVEVGLTDLVKKMFIFQFSDRAARPEGQVRE